MGTRAAPKTIAESILDPSAVIMEGFHSVSVLTDEGQVFQGFIKQESGLNVELVQVDGKVVSIPRESIELRKRQQVSVMPDGLAKQLSPQHVADLIRFILDAGKHPELLQSVSHLSTNLNQKADAPPQFTFGSGRGGIHQNSKLPKTSNKVHSPEPKQQLDTTAPITFRDDGKALQIYFGKNKLASYIYQHDQVKRPFFAHVKSPSGTQVTRNFPPEKGDRQDHADMHPGIWLAFGDLDGEDFWRNKGRVVHKEFTQGPTSALRTWIILTTQVVSTSRWKCGLFRGLPLRDPGSRSGLSSSIGLDLLFPRGRHILFWRSGRNGIGNSRCH